MPLLAKIIILCTLAFSVFANSSRFEGNNLAKEIILFEANSYRVVAEFNVHAMQEGKNSEEILFNVLAKGGQMRLLV